MKYFCTLFDSNYLTRGLAMIESLSKTTNDFRMYVLCFDSFAYGILAMLNLNNVILISLQEFETPELLRVKKDRTIAEYCWTCTPFIIRFVLETFKIKEVTYVDADLYFFQNPIILIDEFECSGCSVLITEHRYTPEYDQTKESGIYCVQFMTFKADQAGLKILQWWQDRCLEWCYARTEDGKFGDQKYLDIWTAIFPGVHVLQHLGGGVAPWNVQQYTIGTGPSVNNIPIVFYHFHALKWYNNDLFDLGIYRLSSDIIRLLYKPYIFSLKSQLRKINSYQSCFNKGIIPFPTDWKTRLQNLTRRIKGTYNVIKE